MNDHDTAARQSASFVQTSKNPYLQQHTWSKYMPFWRAIKIFEFSWHSAFSSIHSSQIKLKLYIKLSFYQHIHNSLVLNCIMSTSRDSSNPVDWLWS